MLLSVVILLCWQAERDNKSVYFQHVPAADSLATIQPRRLVSATAYTLPAPAALVNDTLMESFAEVPPDKVCLKSLCRDLFMLLSHLMQMALVYWGWQRQCHAHSSQLIPVSLLTACNAKS